MNMENLIYIEQQNSLTNLSTFDAQNPQISFFVFVFSLSLNPDFGMDAQILFCGAEWFRDEPFYKFRRWL